MLYKNSGSTIVADNFFTTLDLYKQPMAFGLGFVGTLRSNKRGLLEIKKHPKLEVLSSEFGFHKNIAICSYVKKKNEAVILL